MFYTGGLSFHFARNPHYVCAFKNAFPDYVPPGYNALQTTLLQKEKSNIEYLLEPVKGEQKDKFFISNLLIDAIRDIGPEKVVQVVTDNAPVCKAVGLLVESRFQHIFWTSCVVHILNLALKSICSPSPHLRYDDVMEECGWIAKLLSVADTRFASTIVMLKRFKQTKHGLEHMVISERWDVYKEDDVEKARAYYSEQWLEEVFGRVAPHQDLEVTLERKKCIERYFSNESEQRKVNEEYAAFASFFLHFSGSDSINDRAFMAPVN
ncbi:hypothetical protein Q3G72_022410 [Acer saccharum]|nr:hypothetical protein Q3G72_022410 [Acer saccharum]